MRVEVFSGWMQLRDPELVPERLRRPVFLKSVQAASYIIADGETPDSEAMNFFTEFNDLLAVAMISEWSFASPITLEGLQDLPSKTYDDVRNAVSPFVSKLIPDFGVDIDPKATTENLNGLDGS